MGLGALLVGVVTLGCVVVGGELVGGEDPAFGLWGAGAVDPAGGEEGGRCGEGIGRECSEDEGVRGGEVVLQAAGQGERVREEGEEVREEGEVRGGVGIDLGERRHLEGFNKTEYRTLGQVFWEYHTSNCNIVAQRPI